MWMKLRVRVEGHDSGCAAPHEGRAPPWRPGGSRRHAHFSPPVSVTCVTPSIRSRSCAGDANGTGSSVVGGMGAGAAPCGCRVRWRLVGSRRCSRTVQPAMKPSQLERSSMTKRALTSVPASRR